MKAAPEVGTAQVDRTIARRAVQADSTNIFEQAANVEAAMYGVAGSGVGQLKIQQFASRKAMTGAAQSNARGGQLAQVLPRILGQHSRCAGVGLPEKLVDGTPVILRRVGHVLESALERIVVADVGPVDTERGVNGRLDVLGVDL